MSAPGWYQDDWTGDFTCQRCDQGFSYFDALREHWSDSSGIHNWCQRCDLDFDYSAQLQDHLESSYNHHICRICNIDFDNDNDLQGHLQSEHWSCFMCRTAFQFEQLLLDHQASSHPYCAAHRRQFRTFQDLHKHLNSPAHEERNIPCPTGCGRLFVNYGAVTLHLEGGTCPSGINRYQIDNRLAQFDTQNLITNNTSNNGNRRRITSGSGPSNNRFSPYSNSRPVISNLATNASYNPATNSYECFFCHRLFPSLSALNQHLSSPRHQYETFRQLETNKLMYKCPNSNCGRSFIALSALVQHVEFGSCGVRQFRGVMNTIENVMGGMRRIGN